MKTLRKSGAPVSTEVASADLPENSAALWARQGRMRAEQGDPVGALRYFRRAIESDIDCIEAWVGLARVFSEMHDGQRSVGCLEVVRMIRARGTDPSSLSDRTILPLS